MRLLPISCFLFLLLLLNVDAAKILVVSPSLAKSIVMLMGRVADTLVEAGHDVVFWIPEVVPANDLNGTRLARIVRMNGLGCKYTREDDKFDNFNVLEGRLAEEFAILQFCEAILLRKEELEELRQEHFDLAFTDLIDLCLPGVVHALDIPLHILISTGRVPDGVNWFMGNPMPLSYVPSLQDTLLGPVMSFWDRSYNLFMYGWGSILLSWMYWKENALFRKHVSPDFPPLQELWRRSPLCFVAGDEFINPATPTLDKFKYIGGIGIDAPKELPPSLSLLVEKGKEGVVLFSLGTATPTHSLNREKMRSIFQAFTAFPQYHFIVKVTKQDEWSREQAALLSNVDLVEWVPQTDLLGHPRLRLFISHGGYNSILESAIRGVPMITIPLFFDQFGNAKAAEYRGYARIVQKSEISKAVMETAIGEVLGNKKYKKSAERLAKLHRTKPNQPKETLLEWTQFVLDSGGALDELVPEGAKMGLIEYFCLDIIFVALSIVVLALYLVVVICGRRLSKQKRKID